ncbi:MAG TPA: AAA family ATPase, partial [Gaiellaceae bacterium]
RVRCEARAPLEAHGKSEPVAAFRFAALAEPPAPRLLELVGRTRELGLLRDAFVRVVEGDAFHLFTLLGPAGIGKSRLATEFVSSLPAEAVVATGRCLSYGKGITFWPLVEILRGLGEPAQPALERLLDSGVSSRGELAWAVRETLERVAHQRPLVLVVDDLHWGEPALLDLLDALADLSRDAPILLLCLARPELLEERPGWGGGKLNATALLLEPLPAAECDRLAAALDPQLREDERRRAVEASGGNPLFLEELTAYLAAEGRVELPPRIQALLQARLDRLPEPELDVLSCAAVAGRHFSASAVRELAPEPLRPELDRHLTALIRKELIRADPTTGDGEPAFRFRHELIADAAYRSLPKAARADLHTRMVDWLERHVGERAELDELAAVHLEQAARLRRALGTADAALEQRAAVALAAAGRRARGRADLHAAADLWSRALELLDSREPVRLDLEVELALVLVQTGDAEAALRVLEDAEGFPDDASVAAARLARLQARWFADPEGVPGEIRRECARAIPLFESRRDDRKLAIAWETLGMAEWAEARFEAAGDAYARTADHAAAAGDRGSEAFARGFRILLLACTRIPLAQALAELRPLRERFPGDSLIEPRLLSFESGVALHAR